MKTAQWCMDNPERAAQEINDADQRLKTVNEALLVAEENIVRLRAALTASYARAWDHGGLVKT